jgi:hypothetical protein
MKTTILNIVAATLVAASTQTHAQGTLVYDQQSATSPYPIPGTSNFVDGLNVQEDSPLMQSFTPTLSAIGFVQFEFWDIAGNGNNGATVYVNLWTGSPNTRTATLLGSTTPVFMQNGFVNNNLGLAGITNFYFSTRIALTPGQTYYLQPVVSSGDDPWDIITIGDTYPNGLLYGGAGGFTAPFQPSVDLWFREGVVPEPQSAMLALVGLALFLTLSRKRRQISLLILAVSLTSFGPYVARAQVGGNRSVRGGVALPLPPDLRLVPPQFFNERRDDLVFPPAVVHRGCARTHELAGVPGRRGSCLLVAGLGSQCRMAGRYGNFLPRTLRERHCSWLGHTVSD